MFGTLLLLLKSVLGIQQKWQKLLQNQNTMGTARPHVEVTHAVIGRLTLASSEVHLSRATLGKSCGQTWKWSRYDTTL